MRLQPMDLKQARAGFLLFFTLTCLGAGASCKQSELAGKANGNVANANSAAVADETSTTPPFATKEPDRYQATTFITSNSGDQALPVGNSLAPATRQVQIARDGDKRRTDYELAPGVKVSFLELPAGRYLLYPQKRVYAEINLDESNDATDFSQGATDTDFSPDKLLHEARAESHYERLGTEAVNGRTTTKYRVTTKAGMDQAKSLSLETTIWVDESLGMPIKSETVSPNGASFMTELRDIRQEVAASLFEIPPDYKKVAAKEILDHALPAIPSEKGHEKAKAKKQ